MTPSAVIRGTGHYTPPNILTNADFERMVDTSNEWIVERTGIRERHVLNGDRKLASSDMAVEAARQALDDARMSPDELDAILIATVTPDYVVPSTATVVQHKLGVGRAAVMDIVAACAGFIYGLAVARAFILSGTYRNVLVVGVEYLTSITNYQDRNTCVLFGDGAGAAILVPGSDDSGPLAAHWGGDGNLAPLLYQPAGGTRIPFSAQVLHDMSHTVHMEGNSVFKHAVRAMGDVAVKALKDAGLSVEQVKLIIPHQANLRIMEAVRSRIGYPREQQFEVVEKYGNMSAATIPICLDEARRQGRIQDGDTILMTAFGTGFTWAASVWRW